MIKYCTLLIVTLVTSTNLFAQFNRLSQNGITNEGKGYQFEFQGKGENNCLNRLGQSWNYQPVNWTVSINETENALVFKPKPNLSNPKENWYIDNYISDSNCAFLNDSNRPDFSNNLSLSYRVKSNKAISNFTISPTTYYFGGDFYAVMSLSFYPTVSLPENEWITVNFELCRSSPDWGTQIPNFKNFILNKPYGFDIWIQDSKLATDPSIVIELDYVRMGEAAAQCSSGITSIRSSIPSFEVIPNPCSEYFSLKGESNIERLEISDLNNNLIQQLNQIDNNNQQVFVGNLKAGVYLLKLFSKNHEVYVRKLIKN